MTYDQEILADIISFVFTAMCFGIWQNSFFAGIFLLMVLLEWKAVK